MNEQLIFFDPTASDEGGLLLKELILRGYRPTSPACGQTGVTSLPQADAPKRTLKAWYFLLADEELEEAA